MYVSHSLGEEMNFRRGMASRNYSDPTLKILSARSGNQCAMPGCHNKLIGDNNEVLGEIAHIRGLEPDAQRYDKKYPNEKLNDYENLMFVCANHHKEIDPKRSKSKYTAVELLAIKKKHEHYIQSRLEESLPTIRKYLHLRNLNFTGRESFIEQLLEAYKKSNNAVITQTIKGLGGIGKTELANEYSYLFAGDYNCIWWIGCDDESKLKSGYTELGFKLKLFAIGEQEEIKIEITRNWLESNPNWLLVFDNVEKPKNVTDYLPKFGMGHVIITSRYQYWSGIAEEIPMEVMKEDEAVNFLLKRSGRSDEDGVKETVKALGYLPLALEQAGAYIRESTITFKEYLHLYENAPVDVLMKGLPANYPEPVARTWQVSFKKLSEESDIGVRILNLCAFMDPDSIPKWFLKKCVETALKKETDFPDAVAAIQRYSLFAAGDDYLHVHRLVQDIVRANLVEEQKTIYLEVLIGNLYSNFGFEMEDTKTRKPCSDLLPHVLEVLNHARKSGIKSEETVRISYNTGEYLKYCGKFLDAITHFENALADGSKFFEEGYWLTINCHINIGYIHYNLGNLDKAEDKYKVVLDIAERKQNEESQAVAYNNLGIVYKTRGDLYKAIELHEKSLKISEKLGFKEGIASYYCNLGLVYQTRGDLDKAVEMHEKALKIDEELGRKEGMAANYGNLGNVYQTRGDLDKAVEMHEKALEIDVELGRKEGIASNYGNLGNVYGISGDLDKAVEMYEKTLEIEKELGRKGGMANAYSNLGIVCRIRGDLGKAVEMFIKALEIEKELGHKERLANVYSNLGVVYRIRGDLGKAVEMFIKALEIEKELGIKRGWRMFTAIWMYKKALKIDKELRKKEGLAIAYSNLGRVYEKKKINKKQRNIGRKH